jgi:hypothetical protein
MNRRSFHAGYTLLEVVLALGLTVVVMTAIGTAIFLHLRSVDHTRITIERDQLARTLMRRIGDDVRSAVRREPFDDAGLKSLMESAKNAAGSLGGAAGGAGAGGSGAGGSGGNSPASGTTGRTGTTSSTGTTGGTGTTQRTDGSSDDAAATDDAAAAGAPAAIAGLYGTAYELQIDVARVPRPDEFVEAMLAGGIPPSDVKTVYYFLANASTGISASGATGLMRSEMNRATALFASENGDFDIFTRTAEVLASEVVGLNFSYFDGIDWYPEWNSQEMNGLPLAVEISLVIADPATAEELGITGAIIDPTVDDVEPELVYHTVIHLPNGQLAQPSSGIGEMPPEEESSSSGTGSGTSGASSSGTSGM